VLPDLLAPDLRLLVCGSAASTRSAERGHYYAGPGNRFWEHLSLVVGRPLTPEDDHDLLAEGIGFTDLAKDVAQSHDRGLSGHWDVPAFTAKVERFAPRITALNSLTVARRLHRDATLGQQDWSIGPSRVFVLPSSSGANNNPAAWGGRASRAEWFLELRDLL
jgi:TDG/mug DNA glycosylase family protein